MKGDLDRVVLDRCGASWKASAFEDLGMGRGVTLTLERHASSAFEALHCAIADFERQLDAKRGGQKVTEAADADLVLAAPGPQRPEKGR